MRDARWTAEGLVWRIRRSGVICKYSCGQPRSEPEIRDSVPPHDKRAAERKNMVGSGDRSDKIRTYNFPDNRCTDHRIGLSLYRLDQIIRGDMQAVTDALIEHDRNELRASMGGLEE